MYKKKTFKIIDERVCIRFLLHLSPNSLSKVMDSKIYTLHMSTSKQVALFRGMHGGQVVSVLLCMHICMCTLKISC